MKIKVKSPFFDERGIHKKGEIVEVNNFDPNLHSEIIAEKTVETKKPVKASAKKK